MQQFIMYFGEINKSHLPYAGGKGANLGELTAAGFPVPQGFCITTLAYRKFIQSSNDLNDLLASLDRLDDKDISGIHRIGQLIREHLESIEIPEDIRTSILKAWQTTGPQKAYAVRSSATAEDLPGASFAGQQDTFLNVNGADQLLLSVKRCWASLFTDRSISYRIKNGFDHHSVSLSVVVQEMVFSEVSGIMFTADPITGHRRTIAINAGFGLGEALVSGLVSADLYHIRSGKIIYKQVSQKKKSICSIPSGGTMVGDLPADRQMNQALPDEKILELARLGESIETYYGTEQDIEWCWADGKFHIVQSRPITTLYPLPHVSDNKLRLFLSFGHFQMMTEPIKPLGLSVLRTLIPFGKASIKAESEFVLEAGSRLFIDISELLQYTGLRKRLPNILSNVDELFGGAVEEFCGRAEFQAVMESKRVPLSFIRKVVPTFFRVIRSILYHNNDKVIAYIQHFMENSLRESNKKLQAVSGPARITLIQEILPKSLFAAIRRVAPNIGAGVATYRLIENFCKKWLGDAQELGDISKSPPGNVTTEMGLALGDVADVVRTHPAVITYFHHACDSTFWDDLKSIPGGEEVMPGLLAYFNRYGMRGTGEIDITRPRWRETPTQLLPAILNHLKNVQPGRHRLDFKEKQAEAQKAINKLIGRLQQTRWGRLKSYFMLHLIKAHRSVIGIREHPKYLIVQTLDLIKQAILQEADSLADAGILTSPEEIFWFSLEEIKKILSFHQVDRSLITQRREKFQNDTRLSPPRAITSEGEIIAVKPKIQIPPDALAGSPVSRGTVEGRARVILRLEDANLEKGDILVAPFTDPAWTSLFPLISGLVTEVGGLMTHGAVVAREYGIPAVAGIEGATRKIQDGQTIHVDGTQGIITILDKKVIDC